MSTESASYQAIPSSRTFPRLLHYLAPYRRQVILSVAILLAATATDVFQPILIKIFIDRYLIPRHFPENIMIWLGIGYMGLVVTTSLLNVFQLLLFQILALDIIQRLRVELFDKVQEMALAYFDRTPVGVLVSRITNDTEAILDMFMTVLSSFVQNITMLAGILIAMFALDARLAALCLVLIPVIIAVMVLYQKVSSPIFHQSRMRLA
ncbi:MAG: ABC transporter transmembrane domain-containing protein, partial [Sulfobacillus sp.]